MELRLPLGDHLDAVLEAAQHDVGLDSSSRSRLESSPA